MDVLYLGQPAMSAEIVGWGGVVAGKILGS
jgi:hypothetical protein